MKTFLTLSDGTKIESPQWLLCGLENVRRANRQLSRKAKGSGNRKRARLHYAKVHEDISNQRRDWFYKLARSLTTAYTVICLEDLNLDAMKRLWGRKVSDLGFAEFVCILEYEALLNGCEIVKIDRWFPSSKACHCCGTINDSLALKDRTWNCPSCHAHLDRDVNAAINILNQGMLSKCGKVVI